MTTGHRMKLENKKPNVVYNLNTPFIEFLDDLRRIDICPEARIVYEDAYVKHPTYTLGQIINKYPLPQSWAYTQLMVYDKQLGEDVKLKYFGFITDDIMNYNLWKELKSLNGIEKKLLRNKFKGKLPNIERHINDSN